MVRRSSVFMLLALLAGTTLAAAATGGGELSLDSGAAAAVLAAELPAKAVVAIPPLGQVTVKFQAPETVTFRPDGGEANIGVLFVEPGLKGSVLFRLHPAVDSRTGAVRLTAVRAQGQGALAALPDMASLLRPIDLQGTFDSILDGPQGAKTKMTTRIVAIDIRNERLVIKLGFDLKPVPRGK